MALYAMAFCTESAASKDQESRIYLLHLGLIYLGHIHRVHMYGFVVFKCRYFALRRNFSKVSINMALLSEFHPLLKLVLPESEVTVLISVHGLVMI